MIFGAEQQTFYQDTTTQVAIITTIGVIIVALIGVYTARITSGARKEVKTKADEASKSAGIARDYAAALEAKDALIDSLEERILSLEQRIKRQAARIKELERREDEHAEQQRAAASLERSYSREIEILQALLEEFRREKET